MKKALYILGILNDEDIRWLVEVGDKKRMPANELLITEGEYFGKLAMILDGELNAFLSSDPSKVVTKLGVGDIVGEMSFVDARPPSASVKTAVESIVLEIDQEVILDRLKGEPAFAARFYNALAVFISYRLRGVLAQNAEGGEDDGDELDFNMLDNLYLAGLRFERILKETS